ncbi:MAG TPA: HAMP domain-containing sensor histidine kinase [Anaeromyxobacteraceae bacterium]|nr:HAMP domain-containing sensor histidine kinase [Anaeromyxobacteraceae bacterium]
MSAALDPVRPRPAEPPPEVVLQRLALPSGAAPIQIRWPWRSFAYLVAFYAVAVAALWAGGHPRWRVAGVAALCAVQAAPTLWFAVRGGRSEGVGAFPRGAIAAGLVHVATSAGWMALTGGLRSPFLVGLLRPVMGGLALFNWGWRMVVLLAATAGSLLLLALQPERWAGPPPAGLTQDVLVAATALSTMLVIASNLARGRGALRASAQALARVREELASQALARSRTLEEVGAKVAHELRNPLTAVKALAQVGASECPDPESRDWFGVIGREATRMEAIVAEYLSYTRPLQPFRPEPVALAPILGEVLALLSARAARAGVRLERRGDAAAVADPQRLQEALLNLVANAIEATHGGGSVAVELGGEDGQARIVIRDTGRGMAPDVLARIGTPFFTTREAGTGLGVVLARSVFHQLGGGLHYESAPGQGTTVTATLPAAARRTHGERALGG